MTKKVWPQNEKTDVISPQIAVAEGPCSIPPNDVPWQFKTSISVDHWRAELGQWHDYQFHFSQALKTTQPFYQFVALLSSFGSSGCPACFFTTIMRRHQPKSSSSYIKFRTSLRNATTINHDGFSRLDLVEQSFIIDEHFVVLAITEIHRSLGISDQRVNIYHRNGYTILYTDFVHKIVYKIRWYLTFSLIMSNCYR